MVLFLSLLNQKGNYNGNYSFVPALHNMQHSGHVMTSRRTRPPTDPPDLSRKTRYCSTLLMTYREKDIVTERWTLLRNNLTLTASYLEFLILLSL